MANCGVEKTLVQGRVKWFNNLKGFGFIARDDGPAIIGEGYKTLAEEDTVEFEVLKDHKKQT